MVVVVFSLWSLWCSVCGRCGVQSVVVVVVFIVFGCCQFYISKNFFKVGIVTFLRIGGVFSVFYSVLIVVSVVFVDS